MISNAFLQINDPVYRAKESYSWLDKKFLPVINDPRDLPFVHLTLALVLIFPALAVWLFVDFSWWIAAVYLFLNWAVFLGPFILMLHNTSHRSLFKNKFKRFNFFIPWLIGPLFGETPKPTMGITLPCTTPKTTWSLI